MGFDRKLSIKERIIKRRRQRRKRFFIVVCFLTISLISFVAIINALNHKDEEQVFSDKWPVKSDAQITTIVESTPSAIPNSIGEASSISLDDDFSESEDAVSGVEDFFEENVQEDNEKIISGENLNYDELKDELKEYISKYAGQYGIYYIDLANGFEFGIDDTDEYTAASTVKVPLNYYIYKKIEAGEVDPKKTLAYIEADFEGGTGILQTKKLKGKTFTIKYLLELSITYSDNIATNILLRYIGRKNLKSYMRSLGGTVVDDNKNVSCPKDMAIYLKNIYEFCNTNGELGKELKHNLCSTVYNDRLPKLLPKEIEVGHKVGDQIQAVHDVGIIYTDKPYILAVMSKGVISDEEANNVISKVSKMVYDYVKDR